MQSEFFFGVGVFGFGVLTVGCVFTGVETVRVDVGDSVGVGVSDGVGVPVVTAFSVGDGDGETDFAGLTLGVGVGVVSTVCDWDQIQ